MLRNCLTNDIKYPIIQLSGYFGNNTQEEYTMAKLANVVQLNNDKAVNPYGTIHTYLERLGQESKNTKKTYERAIRDFFQTMRGKSLEMLLPEDLIFKKDQIKSYQVSLKEGHAGSTVNNAITAIRECYKELADDGFPVDIAWFNVKRYDESDKKAIDALTHDEVVQVIQLVSKTRKGSEKALMCRIAYATAFRKESIHNLKWTDIIDREGTKYIKTLGKGNVWDYKKLSHDLYSALMAHKETSKGEKIFELTPKTVRLMMDYIRKHMDFGDRNISFHSFKKASIEEVAVITNYDIKAMQRQGNHADVKTTLNDYMSKKALEDLVVVDINNDLPVEKFDELSHEALLALVKSMDRGTQVKMLQKLEDQKRA